jgi:hypothetical protein
VVDELHAKAVNDMRVMAPKIVERSPAQEQQAQTDQPKKVSRFARMKLEQQ